jgi:DNA-binding MurR/RpiR family transcriptional regulator
MPDAALATSVRIRALVPSLAPAERRVAERVLADPNAVAASTISSLARDCLTSETTVIRFCRAVGFSGYPALRLALAAEHGRSEAGDSHQLSGDIAADDDLDKVVAKIAFADARAVEETAQQLDLDALHAVIEALVGAGRIDVYGVGASGLIALDFQQKLHRIGRVSYAWSDAHIMLTSAAVLGPGDVAIGISHSGSTKDVVESLQQARRAGATTIAITNFSPSPITRAADVALLTASPESPLGGEVLTSRIAQLCVIDVLSVMVAVTVGERCLTLIEKTSQAVRKKRY